MLPSKIAKREAQRSAIAKLKQNRAEKKAWEEDNAQRKHEDKPTRTMLQYRADLNPPPQPQKPQNQPKGEPKAFDPREPQPDRLPNVKIPLAKTDSHYRGIRQYKEEMAKFRRPEIFHRPKTTIGAGIKRRTEEQRGDTPRKLKTDAVTAKSPKRKADEHSSGPAKRPKVGSFMDYLPKAETQIEANNGSKACTKPKSTDSKNKAREHNAGSLERSKVRIVAPGTQQTDGKKTVTDVTAKVKPATKSHNAGTKREAEELHVGATREPELYPASLTGTAEKKAVCGDTSKVGPQKKFSQDRSATADKANSAKSCEGTGSGPLVTPVPKPPVTTNCEDGHSKMKIEDTVTDPDAQTNEVSVESNETRTKEGLEATKVSDKTKSQIEPATASSGTLKTDNKRKRHDEIESPVKKSKLHSSNPENSLRNYRQACFINASLHILHSVPAFASMRNEKSDMTPANNILNEAEMKSAVAGGRTRTKEDSREKLRDHLRVEANRNELKLLPYLNDMMLSLSADRDSPYEINPFIFQQVCGTMFTGNEDEPMNGETQEDAHEFITKLLSQIRQENPGLNIDELLGAQFAEQQVCKCGSVITFTEESCNFNIPEEFQRYRVDLGALLTRYLRDKSKFAHYRCEKCGDSGKWSTKDGWDQKLMTKSPEYLIANVPRGHIQQRGHRMEEVKLTTKVRPPLKKISIPCADGGRAQYYMVAMIKHEGKNLHRGHYTTIRRIGNQWWHCDDAGKGGVTALTRADIRHHEDGCVFLLKKTSEGDVEEAT